MNVNVDKKSVNPRVTFQYVQYARSFREYANLPLPGRYADYEPAAEASKSVLSVLRHFVPEQKELPFEKSIEEKSETPARSKASADPLPY